MPVVEEPRGLFRVLRPQRLDHPLDALVLAHHVTDAAVERRRQPRDVGGRCVAQPLDPEKLAGPAALGAPLVVGTGRVVVTCTGVEHPERPRPEAQRHRLGRERRHVDPQRVARRGAEDRQLVEQPGVGARPLALDGLAEPRDRNRLGWGRIGDFEQRQAGRDRQGRRRREAAAERQAASNLEPGAAQPKPRRLELGSGAPDVGAPPARAFPRPEQEAVALAEVAGESLDHLLLDWLGRDLEAAIERERKAEPAVVVGVFADQVDSSRGERGHALGHGR